MTEEAKNEAEEERKMLGMVMERLKMSPEFVEARNKLKFGESGAEKLEAIAIERKMILEGAGPEAVEKQHKLGRLTARERVSKLMDEGAFRELDMWHRPYETDFDIGEERGRGDGMVIGYGRVDDRPLSLWAQDATIMGGTLATVSARKANMIMDDTVSAKVPIVGIFDSQGLRAHDVIQYPEVFSTSTMALFHAYASGVVPTIALVMGPCTEDLAIIAMLSDFVFMVRDTSYMHLSPPPPGMTSQELGDPWKVHAKVTGSCDVICDDDEDCLKKCRQLLSFLPSNNTQKPPIVDTGDDPNRREEELLEIVPSDRKKPYNMYRAISLIVDNGEFFELKRYWASNVITGFARLAGRTVGLVASNPMDKAGCMNIDAANKQSKFTRCCDAFNIPLIYLQDNPAFLPAIDEETRGLIRTASGMIMINTEITTPQITVTLRKAYGGGTFATPGKQLMGDLGVAWPTYEQGLMGPEGAVAIIYGRQLGAIEDPAEKARQTKMRVMEMDWGNDMLLREARQDWIDPRETRPWLINALRWLENRHEEIEPRKHDNFRV
ncbi:acyl-CoA carboxylase subunit beta [Chloroflexota bacterium]